MPFKNPHPLYGIWQGMRRRCLTPTYRQWGDYGGRGIKICSEWDNFAQFAADMGARPSPQHSLDRIDNDGDYSAGNCRWTTRKEQQRNQRRAVFVEIEGKRYRAIELAEIARKKADTIVARAKAGMPYDKVISKEKFPFMDGWQKAVAVRVFKQRNATHCKHGHPWSAENTAATPQGWKRCKTCHRLKMNHLNAKKRCNIQFKRA